jgi:phage-related protein
MSSLADVYVQVRPDVGGVARTMQSAGADSGRRFGAGFRDTVKTAIGNSLSTALDSVARGIGRGLKAVVVAGSDLNETISKSGNIFGKNFGAIDKFARGAATSVGLSRQAALEATASFGDMFSQLGFGGDQAAKMSVDVVKLSADIGSFNNLPTADVQERIAAAFRGEYDSLQQVIPNINAARVQQEAMAMTGKTNAQSLTAQEKAAATLAIVTKDGARAQGDFARTSGGAANQAKIAKAQLMDMAGVLGTALQPGIQAVMGVLTGRLLPALAKWLPGAIESAKRAFNTAKMAISAFFAAFREGDVTSDGLVGVAERLGVAFRAIWPAVQQAVNVIKPALAGLANFIMGTVLPAWLDWQTFMAGQLLPVVRQLGGFILANLVPALAAVAKFIIGTVVPGFLEIVGVLKQLVATVIPIVTQIVSFIIGKFTEMRPQFMAIWNSVKEIVTGAIFIIKTVILNVIATISTFWARWGDTIMSVVSIAFKLIVGIIGGVMKTIAGIIKLAVALIKGDWKGAWNAIKQIFSGVWDVIKAILKAAWSVVKLVFTTGIRFVVNAWKKFWSNVKTTLSEEVAIWKGRISALWTWTKNAWTTATGAVKRTWSTFWSNVKQVGAAAIDWVRDKISTVLGKIKTAFQNTKDNIKRIWEGVKNVVSAPINWVKDNVYNRPLVPVWNRVAELVNGPKLHAYAEGTKDAAKGWALVGEEGPEFIKLTGGEEVLPHGKKPATLESGLVRQDPKKVPRGGIGDWVKGIVGSVVSKVGDFKDWALGKLAGLAGKLLGGTKGLIDRAMPSSGVGRTVGGIAKKGIDLVLEKIKGDEEGAMMPTGGGPAGSAIASGGWASIYRILRAVGARSFTTYPGHDQGPSRSRDIWPPSQRIADTARRISSLWYVIYNRRIASMNYGRVWRPYYGSNPHTDHVHVTLKPGVKSGFDDPTGLADGGIVTGGRGGVLAAIGEGRQDELVTPLPKGWQREGERHGKPASNKPLRIELNLSEDLRYVIETTIEDAEEGKASMRRLSR